MYTLLLHWCSCLVVCQAPWTMQYDFKIYIDLKLKIPSTCHSLYEVTQGIKAHIEQSWPIFIMNSIICKAFGIEVRSLLKCVHLWDSYLTQISKSSTRFLNLYLLYMLWSLISQYKFKDINLTLVSLRWNQSLSAVHKSAYWTLGSKASTLIELLTSRWLSAKLQCISNGVTAVWPKAMEIV